MANNCILIREGQVQLTVNLEGTGAFETEEGGRYDAKMGPPRGRATLLGENALLYAGRFHEYTATCLGTKRGNLDFS